MKPNIGDVVLYKKYGYFVVERHLRRDIPESVSVLTPCLDNFVKKCAITYAYNHNLVKQAQIKILCKHSDFLYLKRLHGIGVFYHDLSPLYDKLCNKSIKFVTFRDNDTKETIILHLGKAIKVLKKIGETYNGNYERIRVVKPMVKLQFIGELQ